MEPPALSRPNFFGHTSARSRRNLHQQQTFILERLEKMTKMRREPEISEAWNERRIIRARLQAYGSK